MEGMGEFVKVRVRDVVDVIRGFAPESVQESWDNSGLSVGDMNAVVTGVLVGFDCTPELVAEAVECGANLTGRCGGTCCDDGHSWRCVDIFSTHECRQGRGRSELGNGTAAWS